MSTDTDSREEVITIDEDGTVHPTKADADSRALAEAYVDTLEWKPLSLSEHVIAGHEAGQRDAQDAAEMWDRRARTMEALAAEASQASAEEIAHWTLCTRCAGWTWALCTRYAGQAWIALRTCLDQYRLHRAQHPADRWLAWQQLSVDRFRDDVQHREAEGNGRRGK